MKQKIFIIILCAQIGIIVFLFLQIRNKSNNSLGFSISPIDLKTIERISTNRLNFFYEPKANYVSITNESWLPFEVKNTINNDTLNERYDYSLEKDKGVYRIITLGDSFTYGENVSTENNWAEILEDSLNSKISCKNIDKYEVINLGMKGYDTQYEVERYKLRGQKYNPDLVIWLFTDYERILEVMTPLIKKNDTAANKELEKKGIFYNNFRIAREEMVKKLGVEGIKKYQKEQIDNINKYYKGKLIFMTFPDKQEYIELLKHSAEKRPNSYFFQPNIDFNDKKILLPDHHLNEEGNKLLMYEILDKVRNIIPCNQ